MKNKAYSYIRFSSAEQAKGRSQARQAESCEKYCREHGLELAQGEDYIFLDRALSGYKGEQVGDKGQLRRFIELVEDGTIEPGSTLIVESLDRLSRQDVWEALPIFMNLIRKGIRIVTLIDNKVYSDEGGAQDLILSIFILSRANEESSTKAKRVRDAMREKQRKAREYKTPMGKAIPLWLELTEIDGQKQFKVRDDRAAVVRRVFQMAIEGYGRAATAKALTDDGIPLFKPDRKTKGLAYGWGTSSVDKILNNKAVLGIYQPYSVQVTTDGKRQPSGDPIPDYYPQIIDESTFYRAQAAINARRISASTKQTKNFNVWQGIAKCAECGTAMHLINKGLPPKGNTYLQCYQARKGLCKGRLVRLDASEIVFKQMLTRMNSQSLVQDSSGKISKELAEVDGRLAKMKADLEKYLPLFMRTPTGTINDLIARTEQEIAGLEKEKESLQAALATEKIGSWKNFYERLDLVSYEGRHRANALLKRLGVQVFIGKGYYITEKGQGVLAMAYMDGRVGCYVLDEAGAYSRDAANVVIKQLLGAMERKHPFVVA